MPQRAATIESLPAAFEMVKAMQADGLDWGEGYRPLGRQALAEIIETEMAAAVDRQLESLEAEDDADRRNGYYRRSLMTDSATSNFPSRARAARGAEFRSSCIIAAGGEAGRRPSAPQALEGARPATRVIVFSWPVRDSGPQSPSAPAESHAFEARLVEAPVSSTKTS